MVSLAAVSAVLQYKTHEHLELNLDGNFAGDIQKVISGTTEDYWILTSV